MKSVFIVISILLSSCDSSGLVEPGSPKDDQRAIYLDDLEEKIPLLKLHPITNARDYDPNLIKLGEALYFDPILSANKDIACIDCHIPQVGLSNDEPLSIGTKAYREKGELKLGERKSFTPRNVPDLYNRDQPEIRTMFWDARLEKLKDGRVVVYDKIEEKRKGAFLRILDPRLDSVIAAQAMLPVLNRDEFRGHSGDFDVDGKLNLIAKIGDADFETSWNLVFAQVWEIPAYRDLIRKAYPDLDDPSLDFVHLANALGAYISATFTFVDSPWDTFLRGDKDALSEKELYGATLFFGKARCGECHKGTLLTDEIPYNIGVRPISPGPDPQRGVDYGAQHRSHFGTEGRYAFRTPPLRNVELNPPYMHNGMYRTLEEVIEHKNDAWTSFWKYEAEQLAEPYRSQLHTDSALIEPVTESLAKQMKSPLSLSEIEKEALIVFLKSLTSPQARALTLDIPERTISGLKRR